MSDTTLSTSETFAPVADGVPAAAKDRWSAGRSFCFVVFTSAGLWAAIIAAVVSLI